MKKVKKPEVGDVWETELKPLEERRTKWLIIKIPCRNTFYLINERGSMDVCTEQNFKGAKYLGKSSADFSKLFEVKEVSL